MVINPVLLLADLAWHYILGCKGPHHVSPTGAYHSHRKGKVGTGHSTAS